MADTQKMTNLERQIALAIGKLPTKPKRHILVQRPKSKGAGKGRATTGYKLKSGYAYELTGAERNWKTARDDNWDTIMQSAAKRSRFVGTRYIDGALCAVFKQVDEMRYLAQTVVMARGAGKGRAKPRKVAKAKRKTPSKRRAPKTGKAKLVAAAKKGAATKARKHRQRVAAGKKGAKVAARNAAKRSASARKAARTRARKG